MNCATKLACALLMAVVSNAAMAGKGAYVLADLGQSSYGGGLSSPIGFRIGGGYNFTEIKGLNIGAEGAYADFGSATATNVSVKSSGLMASAVVNYAIHNVHGLAILGKLGLAHVSTSATVTMPPVYFGGFLVVPGSSASYSGTSNGIFFGVGVQYDFAKDWAVRGQYEDFGSAASYGNTSAGLARLSVGAEYKF